MKLPDDVRAFLDAPRFAALGTVNPDGSPHLTVMWYERRSDEVVFNTTGERIKSRNLAGNPRVSLIVGESDRYVRLDGVGRLVASGEEALEDIRRLGVRYDGEAAAERQARAVWGAQQRVTFAIAVRHVYRYGFD
jgi:PPOX class probable F420-dependent enzyme